MTEAGGLAVAALKQVTNILGKLTSAQLEDLASGKGQLVYQSADALISGKSTRRSSASRTSAAGSRKATTFDVEAVAAEVGRLGSAAEVISYLESSRCTVQQLRAVAAAIGPTVVLTGRLKEQIIRDVADGAVGQRQRSRAMSDGAWAST